MAVIKKAFLPLATLALLIGGCGSSPDSVPQHTPEEAKAIQDAKNMTPEQQIERIQSGGMPESAKAAMIQEIKQKHGIK